MKTGLFLGKGRLGRACWEDPLFQEWESLSRQSSGTTYRRDLRYDSLEDLPSYQSVVFALAPQERTYEAYQEAYIDSLRRVLNQVQFQRFIFCSSTVVYAENTGRWINEDSPLEHENFRATLLQKAEKLVQIQAPNSIILRFSGLTDQTGPLAQSSPGRWCNRVSFSKAANAIVKAVLYEGPCPQIFSISQETVLATPNEGSQITGRRISSEKAKNLLGWLS